MSFEPLDVDGDGFTVDDGDCDDAHGGRYPGAYEACDAIDNDCNDVVDDDAACSGVERFSQVLEADVLFVVDASAKMEPFLADIGDWSNDFALEMAGPGADVNLGLITMDMTSPGLVTLGHWAYVSAGVENGVQRVTDWLQMALAEAQTDGDSVPRGRDSVLKLLFAADAAVEADELQSGEAEPWFRGDFRRTEVPLAVVFISRNDDQSVVRANEFYATLSGASPRTSVVAHAFTGFGGACDGLEMGAGRSYQHLTTLSEGLVANLCTMTSADLVAVGQAVADQGLVPYQRITADVDVSAPMSVTIEPLVGPNYVLEADGYDVDVALRRLILTPPPPAGSGILFEYQRVPE